MVMVIISNGISTKPIIPNIKKAAIKLGITPINDRIKFLNRIKNIAEIPNITIADFGAACTEDEFYEEDFGTRYYRAPEVVLMGKISNKVDINLEKIKTQNTGEL